MVARLLGVNIDHVATIRQARKVGYPQLDEAIRLVEQGGADFITAHLREDRRHILDADLLVIMQTATTWLNLEVALVPQMLDIALQVRPRTVCIVPEKREELTTEGGLEVASRTEQITAAIKPLRNAGIGVSLFIDPDQQQIDAASRCGVDAIELHTGVYANAQAPASSELATLKAGVAAGLSNGLQVNLGHGLTLANAPAVAKIDGVCEYNIGHSIVAHALFVGLVDAVAQMRDALGL